MSKSGNKPPLKPRLIQSLVWFILTYGAEAWTISKDLRCSINAFEMHCYPKSMKISYTKHVTNETVLEEVDQNRKLLAMVKTRKLSTSVTSHATPQSRVTSWSERCQASEDKARSVSNGWTTSQNGKKTQYRT